MMKYLITLSLVVWPNLVYAQGATGPILPDRSDAFNWNMETLQTVVSNIANYALYLSAAIAIIFIIIGGYKYLTSLGNPEAVQQAKNTIVWAIVGLIVILLAVLIIDFYIKPKFLPDRPFSPASTITTPSTTTSSESPWFWSSDSSVFWGGVIDLLPDWVPFVGN